jgi:orotate phosphoribosyltransferase
MKSLVSVLIEANALRFGSFTLKDGSSSPFFINIGEVATGDALLLLGEHLATGIETQYPDATCLFGPAYKGFTLATATAIALAKRGKSLKVFFDRKEAKTHGEGGLFFGVTPSKDDRIVVLDDVTTSGATKVEAFAKIEATFGVRPNGVLVVVDRRMGTTPSELGFPLRALLNIRDISVELKKLGRAEASVIEAFLQKDNV